MCRRERMLAALKVTRHGMWVTDHGYGAARAEADARAQAVAAELAHRAAVVAGALTRDGHAAGWLPADLSLHPGL